ncbi:MAG: hypothetical protein M3017_16250 [Actinomycetota bacterium]|nr:hypothetical protein [Actinomycetota bacterium]
MGPLSLGENFKQVSAVILGDPQATGTIAAGLLDMAMFVAAGCAFLLLTRRRQMRKELA